MSTDALVAGYLRETERLRDLVTLRRSLEGIAELGFRLVAEAPDAEERSLVGYATPEIAGLSEALTRQCEAFAAGELATLRCVAVPLGADGKKRWFSFGARFEASAGTYHLSVDDRAFEGPYGLASEKRWIRIARWFYDTWRPFYACGASEGDAEPLPSRERVLAMQITQLFGLNFFGPELATHFGRERLLQTPALRVMALSDGGTLLVAYLFSLLALPGSEPTSHNQAAATAYLGLPPVFDYAAAFGEEPPRESPEEDARRLQAIERQLRAEPDAL